MLKDNFEDFLITTLSKSSFLFSGSVAVVVLSLVLKLVVRWQKREGESGRKVSASLSEPLFVKCLYPKTCKPACPPLPPVAYR